MSDDESEFSYKAKACLLTYYLPDMTIKEFYGKTRNRLVGRCFTMSKETCPTTDTSHYHLYVHSPKQMEHKQSYWIVDGVLPDIRPNTATGTGYGIARDRGHFYVECIHKIDHVSEYTNYRWEKYPVPVKASWILTLWKQHKIHTYRVEECLKYYRSATRNTLEIINIALQHERTQQAARIEAERAAALALQDKPFKDYPIIECWKHQYTLTLHRYKFLIVSGPTRIGKSNLIRSHFPDAFVHNDVINWTGYDPTQHTAIMFEDIPGWTEMVSVTHKVMFQAGGVVSVHTSPTNVNHIVIDLTAKPMIILTNDTQHFLWPNYARANSFHLEIDSPTWVEE